MSIEGPPWSLSAPQLHPRATSDADSPDAGTARRQAVNDIPGVTELRLVVRAADHD